MIFLQYKMIFCIDPHYTLDFLNYYSLKLILQGGGSIKWVTTTMTIVHVRVLIYIFHPKHMNQAKSLFVIDFILFLKIIKYHFLILLFYGGGGHRWE